MHIAILEAGRTNPDMPAEFHHYPDMFKILFKDQPNSNDFQFSELRNLSGIASCTRMIHFPITADIHSGILSVSSPVKARFIAAIEQADFSLPIPLERLCELRYLIKRALADLFHFILFPFNNFG